MKKFEILRELQKCDTDTIQKLSTDFLFILRYLLSSEYLLFYERKVGYYTNRQDGFLSAFFFPIAQALGFNSNPVVS